MKSFMCNLMLIFKHDYIVQQIIAVGVRGRHSLLIRDFQATFSFFVYTLCRFGQKIEHVI